MDYNDYDFFFVSDYVVEITNIVSREKTLLQVGHKYVYDPPNPKTNAEKRRKGRIVRLEEIYKSYIDRVYVKYLDTNTSIMLKNPFFLKPYESGNLTEDEINAELFKDWNKNITEEEQSIRNQALNYETVLFNDMRLVDYEKELFFTNKFNRSLTEEELNKYYMSKNRKEYLDLIGVSIENSHSEESDEIKKPITISDWRFIIKELSEDDMGWCNFKAKTISIDKSVFVEGNVSIILIHEMIHAYEHFLREKEYDSYVLIRLYEELNYIIKNLNSIIDLDNNILFKTHSVLFLLKSLKLDFVFGYKFGTFYMYDKHRFFNVMLNNNEDTQIYRDHYKENYNCDFMNIED